MKNITHKNVLRAAHMITIKQQCAITMLLHIIKFTISDVT